MLKPCSVPLIEFFSSWKGGLFVNTYLQPYLYLFTSMASVGCMIPGRSYSATIIFFLPVCSVNTSGNGNGRHALFVEFTD